MSGYRKQVEKSSEQEDALEAKEEALRVQADAEAAAAIRGQQIDCTVIHRNFTRHCNH